MERDHSNAQNGIHPLNEISIIPCLIRIAHLGEMLENCCY